MRLSIVSIRSEQIVSLFLHPEQALEYSALEMSTIIRILRQEKLLARMCYRFKSASVFEKLDEKSQRHLLNAQQIADRQKEQVLHEASELSASLQNVAQYLIFLKGAAYSLCGGKVGSGRIYSDIDVLVPKDDIKACEQRLVIKGWIGQEINDYDDKYYRKWAHEIPPMVHAKRGTIIDVHHNIVPLISKDAPNIELLIQHKEEIMPGLYVLTAPAQLVHAAIHLFRNEDYKGAFRDLTDLFLMLEDQPLHFWQDSLDIAVEIGFSDELLLAFRCLENSMGLTSPPGLKIVKLPSWSSKPQINDYIFSKVLKPQHTLMQGSHTPLAHLLATIRGHILKMPLHILIYHLTVKSCRGMIEAVFGAHIFTPKDANPQIHIPAKDIEK